VHAGATGSVTARRGTSGYDWQSDLASASHGVRSPGARGISVPTYQYACTACGHTFEQVQSFHDEALTHCPECDGRLRKVFNAVGVVFKGSGFYRTDSRTGSSTTVPASGPSDGSSGTSSGSSDSSSSSSGTSGSSAGSDSSSGSSGSSTSGGSSGSAGSGAASG
jgi:putative FmdB family regulatory protein